MLTSIALRDRASGAVRNLPLADFRMADRPAGILWIDVLDPAREDVAWLESQFGFHPLALEDCLKDGQRPKVETYDGYHFLDIYAGSFDPTRRRVELREVDVFVGEGYVVTSHKQPVAALAMVRERWQRDPGQGSDHLLYLLLDTLVDDYFPIVDQLEDLLEDLEERLFSSFKQRLIGEIFNIRKQLVLFRKVVAPTRDVCLWLARRETELITAPTALYLQDVYDHLIRVADSLDTYRDLVTGALEAYMSVVANRTNDTMKRLTTISAILMTVALVPSIYGMNFKDIPELSWSHGYEYAWALMLGLALVLTIWFKAIDYF